MVVLLQKIDFHCFVEWRNRQYVNISVIWSTLEKVTGMVVLEIGVVLSRSFVSTLFSTLLRNHKNYCTELKLCMWVHRRVCCYKVSPLLSELKSINGKSYFDNSYPSLLNSIIPSNIVFNMLHIWSHLCKVVAFTQRYQLSDTILKCNILWIFENKVGFLQPL